MALWMAPVIAAVMLMLFGFAHDLKRWWRAPDGLPEDVRWWFDQRRALRTLQAGEAARRAVLDWLEAEWEMPCAPDPKRRTA